MAASAAPKRTSFGEKWCMHRPFAIRGLNEPPERSENWRLAAESFARNCRFSGHGGLHVIIIRSPTQLCSLHVRYLDVVCQHQKNNYLEILRKWKCISL